MLGPVHVSMRALQSRAVGVPSSLASSPSFASPPTPSQSCAVDARVRASILALQFVLVLL
jgi:hypothetical protein